ncbi:MAG: DMT family transporter [Candidatus Thioglobus sp.]|jgi:drug/metabolite transporter (DMT)-like permease|nr:DMT family transporter [Candidatus Pseudothioglobus aerophilus]MBT3439266.1 DMT family transporter [Gammaproteobacteria bacterium]MBT3953570.1 DMT family transporter [Rhodobacterales bacterium]MDP0560648.1 DMT family transporter [Candidatus Thioglobus sp.]MBT4245562.1 DMT family transporter [Gammaproteobacteria bacterium]
MNNHLKGLLIAFFGVLMLTPDPVLVRLADADTFTILFWRGIFYALGVLAILFATYRKNTFKELKNIGRPGIWIGILSGIGGVTFIAAIQYTSIAKVLVIISTAPMVVAIISWAIINEKPKLYTWISMLIIVTGIYIVMKGDTGTLNVMGSSLAVISIIAGGYSFALTRKYSNVNMVPAMIVNALVVSCVGLAFSSSFYLPLDSLIYVIAGGILLAIAFSLITIAPRFIPASEVAMFMPLGTIFGIISAWLVINEQPSSSSILGGSIVVITLFFHAWYSSKLQTK